MTQANYYELVGQKMNIGQKGGGGLGAPKHKKVIEFLKVIWTEEDVELLNHLDGVGKFLSVEKIAERSGVQEFEVKRILDRLEEIGTIVQFGGQYGLIPFVPGIFELYYLTRKDSEKNLKKAAKIFDEFLRDPAQGLVAKGGPAIFRPKLPLEALKKIIKIDEAVEPETRVLPFELVEDLINNNDYFAAFPCQCRIVGDYTDNSCKVAPSDVGCFATGMAAKMAVTKGLGRELSKDEAITYLKRAGEAGLVHNGGNISGPMSSMFVCNCCSCHCGALMPVAKFGTSVMEKTNFEPAFNDELCIQCEICTEKCPVEALSLVEDTKGIENNNAKCIGCGICAINCPENAIMMNKVRDSLPPEGMPPGLELFG